MMAESTGDDVVSTLRRTPSARVLTALTQEIGQLLG
jgi:hypothetical protein